MKFIAFAVTPPTYPISDHTYGSLYGCQMTCLLLCSERVNEIKE